MQSRPSPASSSNSIAAASAGVGLKARHYGEILATLPEVGFFEVHAENFMGAGGPPHRYLEAIRAEYPLSIHGVGLSIGSSTDVDRGHIARLRALIDRYEPHLFSEHLAWSSHGGHFLNDLLPVAYNAETLTSVCDHIDEVQTALGRRLQLENPSTYVEFAVSSLPEEEFLAEIARRTGCRLLLDVNNAYVSAMNQGRNPAAYLAAFPMAHVTQIHLAGHAAVVENGERLLVDDHGSRVNADVWNLYADVIARTGPLPTLIEWDNDVPAWEVLCDESRKAQDALNAIRELAASAEVPRAALMA